jgi:hypothetical protein
MVTFVPLHSTYSRPYVCTPMKEFISRPGRDKTEPIERDPTTLNLHRLLRMILHRQALPRWSFTDRPYQDEP